ncbi:hypothetical protein PRIPAC_96009 [Pristionchus pacificus]|uniref:acid phosphatase n=1 Tax=Pristionchus pacificus TaxID=54126 RepID=A0A2A6D235_PRIPA|nr:hypothetical protein PRIPAC_96009 [Pristionchus pacificus]|eukprot:PDM84504.1 Phosphatase [Pristionchus pacificus]
MEFTSPESAKLFPRGFGEVTNEGLQRAARQGDEFRLRYSQLGLLMRNQKDIYIRSSPIRRTLMSAFAFAIGFAGKEIPPIHTTDSLDDEKASLAEVENSAVRLDPALESCAKGGARSIQFRSLSIRAGVGAEFDVDRARAVIGPLMSIVSKNVADAIISNHPISGEANPPVRMYYTHDHVILAAAQALGIIDVFEEKSPAFSSAIAIEIWSSIDGVEVKVVLKDGVHSPFKVVIAYRLQEFDKLLAPYTSLDPTSVQWDKEATKVCMYVQRCAYTYLEFDREPVPEIQDSTMIVRARQMTEKATLLYKILIIGLIVLSAARVLIRKRSIYSRMR